jgi:hypothetical protein
MGSTFSRACRDGERREQFSNRELLTMSGFNTSGVYSRFVSDASTMRNSFVEASYATV